MAVLVYTGIAVLLYNTNSGNPAPVEDKTSGKIILLFVRDSKNVLKLESADDGVSWGSVQDITRMVMDPSWTAIDTGPPGGIQLPSGRLIICTLFLYKYFFLLMQPHNIIYPNNQVPML